MFNKKTMSSAVAAAATGISLGKALGVAGVTAVASGLSANALAVIDVTGTVPNKVAVSSETVSVTTTGVQPVGTASADELDVTGDLGIGIPADDQFFLRIDWSSAELLSDLAVGSVTVAGATSTSLSGGTQGETSAIFGFQAPPAGVPQTAPFTLGLGGAGIGLQNGGPTDIQVRVFETQGNAISEVQALSDQSVTDAVSLGAALSVSFSAVNATAEVTEDFLKFQDGGAVNTGELGSFTASATAGGIFANADDLTAASFADIVNTGTNSVVTYTGDFSFATSGTAPYFVGTAGACAGVGAVLSVNTTTLTTATLANINAANGEPLCVTVNGTTETIPEANYEAAVSLVHNNTASVPASTSASGSVGDIVRNGTTVEVAYITTFDQYNQRLLINSRHPVAADYTITFQAENGVTTMALGSATGTLQPGENLVLRAADIVEITGATRCSATVTVVAPQGNISVATTQVNLSDGGTDTVSYN